MSVNVAVTNDQNDGGATDHHGLRKLRWCIQTEPHQYHGINGKNSCKTVRIAMTATASNVPDRVSKRTFPYCIWSILPSQHA